MPLDQQDLYEKVNELFDHVDDMNSQDNGFITDAAEYENTGRMFSVKQAEWIEDLYEKYCS